MECDGLPLIMFWLLRGIKVAVTLFCRPSLEFLKIFKILKVVGNEKRGGSRRWHMIDVGLVLW